MTVPVPKGAACSTVQRGSLRSDRDLMSDLIPAFRDPGDALHRLSLSPCLDRCVQSHCAAHLDVVGPRNS